MVANSGRVVCFLSGLNTYFLSFKSSIRSFRLCYIDLPLYMVTERFINREVSFQGKTVAETRASSWSNKSGSGNGVPSALAGGGLTTGNMCGTLFGFLLNAFLLLQKRAPRPTRIRPTSLPSSRCRPKCPRTKCPTRTLEWWSTTEVKCEMFHLSSLFLPSTHATLTTLTLQA